MIKRLIPYSLLLILITTTTSCSTYTNFYSETFTSIDKTSSKIHRLDLSNQNLTVLPDLSAVKNLRMVNLSNNPKLNVHKVFEQLIPYKSIEILILDSLAIEVLPKSIHQFSGLKQLSLAHNPDLDIESMVNQIKNLPIEFLNLKGNNIEVLPANFSHIQSLKDLNLSYNNLATNQNYEIISKLPNLYSLWIDHNELVTLPKSIGKISQIRFLYIDHNKLKELPLEMNSMKTWVIHAGYNSFKELPAVFTKMPSLLMVHINNNNIETIPKDYHTEKYPLAGLILDNNPLSETEKNNIKELFKGFFLLSFEQK